ncbi:efflux transporter outer membrane subunit [Rhodanobacter sp. C03]|uniref:efflux transporter outer membrane subunit n=1 Tax=Rhodanobacter sp. C03 TaxID=1945858 RepID=UPI000984A106|nr:efflux transporter outer membrane subunit [Rhodanobacter sp. C03]OOG53808.1 RND transporter [Rhodanobacter sp. C03]
MKIPRTTLACSLTLLLGGCMVGPDYHRPQVVTPAQYKELPGWTAAAPAAEAPKGDWWTGFNDPLLDQLEPMVSVSNQTVRQDYANYQAALAEVQVARSSLFPAIGISGSATKQRSAGSKSTSSAGSLEGDVSWAPDLWGKVRRTIEENKATAQASAATLANATLSEQTALATAVIELRVTDADIDLLQKTVDAYKEYLRVVTNQDTAGTIPPSDAISARTQLENAQASLIALGVARAKYAHAIAVLVGKNPEELDIPHGTTLPTLPSVPAGVPSTLLQRRPDIAVAEREMAAQNAAVGVAIAAYYPTLSLSAADGFSQSPLAGLLHIANHVWSLGADVSETVFDFGARHGEVAAAKANYEAAVANYRGTVLTAFQNVEDDLSGLRILAQQAEVLDAAVRDATRGAEIAFNEYQAGTVDYTTAATARATELNTQQSALNVQQQRLLDAVSLIGDIGGGWSASELVEPTKSSLTSSTKH